MRLMLLNAFWETRWRGDPTLFFREDYVAEAWRMVDPILEGGETPVVEYEPNSWGPSEVDQKVSPVGGRRNPNVKA